MLSRVVIAIVLLSLTYIAINQHQSVTNLNNQTLKQLEECRSEVVELQNDIFWLKKQDMIEMDEDHEKHKNIDPYQDIIAI